MYPITIIIFFLYCWGFGLGLGLFVKESEDFIERNLMRLGLGLGTFPALGLLLNLIKIPLDWRIFLVISLIPILILIVKSVRNYPGFADVLKKFKINVYVLIVLLLFSITLYMYTKGAFAYPYLEDDDSWSHAVGVKYVAVEKTVLNPPSNSIHYIDPYPPAYDMLIGILQQTNDSVYWSLKFFNALVISLSIIFFYFFVKIFANSSKKALFSTFALFAIPSFLSHFIWSISLTMPLFFVSFYAAEKIKDDKRWFILTSIVMVTALASSPTHSTYFGLFFVIYLVGKTLVDKKFLIYELLAGLLGLTFSFILWWLPMILKHGISGVLTGIGLHKGESVLNVLGTGDKIYTLSDFFCNSSTPCYKGVNMINNPIGIGVVLSFLVIVALIFFVYRYYLELKKYKWRVLIIFFVLTALMMFFLSENYEKYVEKKNIKPLEKGSIPFFEFLSDRVFLVAVLLSALFVFVLLLIASYKNNEFREKYFVIALIWFIFSFYAVNSGPFHYKLSPFRAWMVLAIPVSLMAGEGIYLINNLINSLVKGFVKSSKIVINVIALLVLGVVIYSIITTSFVQKYAVNTALWPPGGFWTSNEEIQGYIWFKDNIPSGTKVFTFSNNALVIGLDKFICHWCDEVRAYQQNGFNQTSEQNYNWLKKEQYKYVIIDGQTTRRMGINQTNAKIQGYLTSTKFKPVFGNNGVIIFKVE